MPLENDTFFSKGTGYFSTTTILHFSLHHLNLGRNKLKTIEDGVFSELTTLVFLDLSHNQIQTITPSNFQGNAYLLASKEQSLQEGKDFKVLLV